MERWIGKSAVVTGASSGIGEAISKSLAIAGMNVIGLARRQDKLEQISNELKNIKGSFQFVLCDVSKEDDILKAFEYVEKKFDGIDVLVNNAGVAIQDTIADGKTEHFRTVLDVNVFGPSICMREAIRSMRKRKIEGHIININSVLGLHASVRQFPTVNLYPASKFALRAMSDTVKNEIKANKDNIRVTSIHPGLVKTEILRSSGFDEIIFDKYPYLESEQIADCVKFALSAPPGTQVDQIVITPTHEQL